MRLCVPAACLLLGCIGGDELRAKHAREAQERAANAEGAPSDTLPADWKPARDPAWGEPRADRGTKNLFAALLAKSDSEVDEKVTTAVGRFFGIGTGEPNELIAVQTNLQKEFDRLWKFAHTFMQYPSDTPFTPWRRYFRGRAALARSTIATRRRRSPTPCRTTARARAGRRALARDRGHQPRPSRESRRTRARASTPTTRSSAERRPRATRPRATSFITTPGARR